MELEQLMLDRLGTSWYEQLESFIISEEFDKIRDYLALESENKIIYPPADKAYNAFKYCSYDKTKVVIVGQDPYHDGSANGLAFSTDGGKLPPSLRIILDTMSKEFDKRYYRYTNFYDLADQGVLLINTALSVEKKKPGSHIHIWKPFTETVISTLKQKPYLVWMLWGKQALDAVGELPIGHDALVTVHPAATTYQPELKFEPRFQQANELLIRHGLEPITWYNEDDDLPF